MSTPSISVQGPTTAEVSAPSTASTPGNLIENLICADLVHAVGDPDFFIDPEQSWHAQGLGSILALRLRGVLAQRLDIDIAVGEILTAPDIRALAERLARRVTATPAADPERTREGVLSCSPGDEP